MRSSSLAVQALNNSHLLKEYLLNDIASLWLWDLSYGTASSSSRFFPRGIALNISDSSSTETYL